MLTRLEVDGFKNLFDVTVEFGPYTCIAGQNALGKSNLFDAIEFLSLVADRPFMEAAQDIRSAGTRMGDPRTLFWMGGSGPPPLMHLAAEMVVADSVYDDFGQEAKATSTFLRYELTLQYVAATGAGPVPMGSVRLLNEDLTYITQSKAAARLRWKHSPKFRQRIVKNDRKGTGFISTGSDGAFQVHQDGGSRGQPRRSAAAPRTVLSTINTSDDPTALAARREMQQWRKLALEPSSMRRPDSITGSSEIGSDGSHLAAALFRMADQGQDSNVYAGVAATASALTDVRAVNVDFDAKRDILTLEARLGAGPFLPSRALSDGTMRFVALSVIEADASFGGVICMEEPENGIHPAKIEAMVSLLRDLAVDPAEEPGSDNPLRQVVVNTHSPRFVVFQDDSDMLLALPKTIVRDGETVQTVSFAPLWDTWRALGRRDVVSKGVIGDYLTAPDDAPMLLDYPGREIEGIA
ncbi:putative ATPase [Microbacterium sp. AG1240]|uniref:AAA family ATPase n=1 Tax=Microbacterium sp. AG1240 TaxID=2183992 RepID=UPI000EAE0969|nr:AAA family ATPase [Microbacterium sp. AG1240]RKT31445.1 putative ATPase [Microbacterium sp. AG1240]